MTIRMNKIKEDDFYTPTEVSEMLKSRATNPDTKKQMILRHIRNGKLKATNLGGEKKPRYVVRGKDIIDYKNRQITAGSGHYRTK